MTNFDLLQGIPEGNLDAPEHADLSVDLELDTWDQADPFDRLAVGLMISGAAGNITILGGRCKLERGLTGAPSVVIVSREMTAVLSLLAARQLVRFCEETASTPREAMKTAEMIRETVQHMEGLA